MVDDLVTLAAVFGMVAAATYAVRRLPDRLVERRHRLRPRAKTPPIELLGQRLRRLSAELIRIQGSRLPAKAQRLKAVQQAYDDTLVECAQALEVAGDPSPHRPLSRDERLAVELALTSAGMRW